MVRRRRRLVAATIPIAALLAWTSVPVAARSLGPWQPAQPIENPSDPALLLNTAAADGCPIQSPDGLSLFMASTRPGGLGGLDIWIARRDSTSEPFGAPVNPGPPVNSPVDDFCPTPVRRDRLFFVSRRTLGGAECGGSDIFVTRDHPTKGWLTPSHLACVADGGPNSALDEQGPSYVEPDGVGQLFYSGGPDIYVSQRLDGWSFGPPAAVAGVNGPASDIQPNVRKDGLEMVFASNDASRLGAHGAAFDLYASTRATVADPWSVPVNLGDGINTTAAETRPSLSWDGRQLLFGRNPGPEGSNDIFASVRTR
jgi:hypothetical protein